MTQYEQLDHDETIRHNAIKETHWYIQRWIWLATVIILSLGIIFK